MAPEITQVINDFSQTVFWNNTARWPGQAGQDDPYPMKVIDPAPPAYETEWSLIRFETGELSVDVAMLPPEGNDADCGNVTSKADAQFIANLPVYIPRLLAALATAEARVKELEMQRRTAALIG
jgi:hypothetical protein